MGISNAHLKGFVYFHNTVDLMKDFEKIEVIYSTLLEKNVKHNFIIHFSGLHWPLREGTPDFPSQPVHSSANSRRSGQGAPRDQILGRRCDHAESDRYQRPDKKLQIQPPLAHIKHLDRSGRWRGRYVGSSSALPREPASLKSILWIFTQRYFFIYWFSLYSRWSIIYIKLVWNSSYLITEGKLS